MSTSIPSHMKAWVFTDTTGGVEKNLQLRNDIPLPPSATSLKTDEVFVKTLATSLNPVDYKIAEMAVVRRLVITRPASPGLDFSGRVVALGPDSGKFKHPLEPGMMIIGRLAMPTQYGPLGEYLICLRGAPWLLPQPYVKEGSNVFINGGSGGVGLFGIQIAKALGCSVIVRCSSANTELCKSVGANKVIDYRTSNVVQQLKKSQHKYHLFVDNVGTKDLYWAMGEYTTEDARAVIVATDVSLADVVDVLLRLFTPSFLAGPGRKLTYMGCSNNPEQLAKIAGWVQEGRVRVVKDEVFAYSDAPRALERLKTSRARGKIVIMAKTE